MRTPSFIPLDRPDDDHPIPTGQGMAHLNVLVSPGWMAYDHTYPAAVSAPLYHIQTQGDTIGETIGETGLPEVNVDIRRTINQSVGGTPGVANKQGYTSGIQRSWRADRFTGGAVHFVTSDLSIDSGPVGVSNRAGILKSAVENQYTVPPTMEEIYASIIGGR